VTVHGATAEHPVVEVSETHVTPDVSVVIPVFGDGGHLLDLTTRVSESLAGRSWEIILVNDGSPRATWRRIQSLAERHGSVRGINLLRNFGQHNALLAGLRASRGRAVVTLDDDLQHPPEQIPHLLGGLGDADVVYGVPTGRVRGWSRNVAAACSKAVLATVFGAKHARHIGAFRAFRGSLRQVFTAFEGPYVSIDVLLGWATSRIAAVEVEYEPRRTGRSGYGAWRLLSLTLSMVTGFSVWPLRLASVLGFTAAVFGLGLPTRPCQGLRFSRR
jgi:undecaprenyl-phosphate 4-deoxy-4-formamido-L-arabinose transferase